MDTIPELRFDCSSEMDAEERRMLTTLKLRLAMEIGNLDEGFISILHYQ
jgi:hypothetical protein